ncbi:hypothetical protein [Aquimarina sp. BL5]|uniref:hypothetical protein n=1 Tax=Aquimarina sp. BL5 TaxID=1714860 RepID=UPI0011C346DC|nr:hypothetical protein [Aquimarina sp. BL5]
MIKNLFPWVYPTYIGETRTLIMRDYFLINTNGIKTKVAYSYGCHKQIQWRSKDKYVSFSTLF